MSSVIERLNGALSDPGQQPDMLTRYIGGSNRENMPYINGYWQFILQLPEKLYSNSDIAQQWFLSTAEGFTPHTRTLNKADIPGQGGMGSSFPTGQTINRTFTVTFREYKNLVMLKTINIWSSVLDPYVGVSPLEASDWIPSSFKGLAYAVFTKPVGSTTTIQADDIEEVFGYDGVWVETSPTDAFNQDISTNDSIQLSVTFNFDGMPITTAEMDKGAVCDLINSLADSGYDQTWSNTKSSFGL